MTRRHLSGTRPPLFWAVFFLDESEYLRYHSDWQAGPLTDNPARQPALSSIASSRALLSGVCQTSCLFFRDQVKHSYTK